MEIISNNKTATNTVEVEFKASAEEFEQAVQAAYLKKKKNINVPGFRKGKAPRKIIEAEYGEGVFYEDAVNGMYQKSVAEVIDELKLEVVDMPNIEVTEVSKENGVSFKATFTTKPEVEIKDYKGIKVNKTVKNVTDEDVANELKRYQEKDARIIDVTDRPLQKGDTAVFDFEGFVDGEAFEGGKAEHFSLEIGSGQFIPGFEEGVVGHKVGESFDVNVTFPTEYHSEELAGKDATFKVTIKELKRKELPTLDDEFAKDVSEFDTLEELKKDLTEKMAAEKKDQADSKMENDLLEQAVKNMTVEIPTVMFENKAQDMVEEFGYRLQTQGMNMDMYMKYTGTTPEALTAQFMPQAEAQVRTTLLLEKIAEVENIEITEEDINGEYDRMVKDYGMELDKVKSIVPVEEIKRQLTIQKAAKVITDSAVVTQL